MKSLYICVNKIDLALNLFMNQHTSYTTGNWFNIINSCKVNTGQPYTVYMKRNDNVCNYYLTLKLAITFIRGGMWKVEVNEVKLFTSQLGIRNVRITRGVVLFIFKILSYRHPEEARELFIDSTIPFTDRTAAFYG